MYPIDAHVAGPGLNSRAWRGSVQSLAPYPGVPVSAKMMSPSSKNCESLGQKHCFCETRSESLNGGRASGPEAFRDVVADLGDIKFPYSHLQGILGRKVAKCSSRDVDLLSHDVYQCFLLGPIFFEIGVRRAVMRSEADDQIAGINKGFYI